MRKLFVCGLILAASGSIASADIVLGYALQGAAGNQASSAATTVGPGITAATLGRGPGITATAAGSSINANGFNSGSGLTIANNDYYSFGFTVDAGLVAIDVTSIVFGLQRSSTGPQNAALYYTIDGGTTLTQIGANINVPQTTSAMTFTPGSTLRFDPGAQVQFRLYGWNAGGSSGTMRITDPNLADSDLNAIAVIPTPGSAALLGVGILASGRRRRA